MDAHFQKKILEPDPPFIEKQKAWALDFLNSPLQYKLHHKLDDHVRTLAKQMKKIKSSRSASGSK